MPRACLLAVLALAAISAAPAVAQDAAMAPTYQRLRSGAGDWHGRGGHNQHWRGGGGGFGGGFGGFYNPFFAPPIVTGSWYERPYPYHFDYYRQRWGGSPNGSYGDPGVEMIPAADCPCLNAPYTASPATPTATAP
jgi:hypothetical protein